MLEDVSAQIDVELSDPMTSVVRLEQLLNAPTLIIVAFEKSAVARLEHLLNALPPMLVAFGKSALVSK